MNGNVIEWAEACWKGNCARRVLRGGSWSGNPEYLRSATRVRHDAGSRYGYYGFRLARTLTP